MTEHLRLIARQIEHLGRMREYLDFSYRRAASLMPITDWAALAPAQHEILAAFRVRFSEFQEHLGRTMRAVAIEEEVDVERFGSVLAFMEKLRILDSAENWKLIRELRNAVNHEYEDNPLKLGEFFAELTDVTPVLFGYFQHLQNFCEQTYGIGRLGAQK